MPVMDREGTTYRHVYGKECQRPQLDDARVLQEDAANRKAVLEGSPLTPLRVVQALAGAGKSHTMIEFCRRNMNTRFLLLTYSKTLQLELEARCEGLPNVDALTYDALCYHETGLSGNLSDAAVSRAFFPKCIPWTRKRGVKGIAKLVERALNGAKWTHVCEYHKQMRVEEYLMRAVDSFANRNLQCFALGRHRATLKHVKARYDCIVVDEVQDMDRTAMEKLQAVGLPMLCFGDSRQQIYGFESTPCSCRFDDNFLPAAFWDQAVPYFASWRLNRTVMTFVNDCFQGHNGVSLKAENEETRASKVVFSSSLADLPAEHVMLVRTNVEVIRRALEDSDVVPVGIHETLRGVRDLPKECVNKRSKLHTLVKQLSDEEFEYLLGKAKKGVDGATGRFVMTVHRSKGSEFKNVVLKESLLQLHQHEDANERNIAYVALTRVRENLYVLI